jgi:DNA-binding LacI/PurR family transcriptional regulator
MGKSAFDQLYGFVTRGTEPKRIILQHELVVRESTEKAE